MPKLSIIIPARNEEETLPLLLNSLANQTLTNFEVIVADAKSEDKTREIAKEHGARVVKGGLPGFGRNAGAKVAKGDILLFLDADVVFNETFLADIYHEFTRRELSAATAKVNPSGDRIIDKVLHGLVNWYIAVMQYIDPHAGGMCIMAVRELHERIGGFDSSLIIAEDHDYVRRIRKLGHGPFRVLKSSHVTVSVRRLDTDGRAGLAFKYVVYEIIQKLPKRWQRDPWNYMQHLGGTAESSGDDE